MTFLLSPGIKGLKLGKKLTIRIFPIRISKNFSKLLRDVFQQYFLHKCKSSLKISFSQEGTSNLVMDLNLELLTESFVNVHLEKPFWWKLCIYKKIVGRNYLEISGRIASRYQRRNQNLIEHLRWSCLRK